MTSSNNKLTQEQRLGIIPRINEKKMTQVEIAKEYGVHVQTIRYWVRRIRDTAKANGVEILIDTRAGRRASNIDLS